MFHFFSNDIPKLLVDAIQSSRFITQKKSFELIKKIGNLVIEYDRKELEREVFIVNRIKNENESIYYNTDNIYSARSTHLSILADGICERVFGFR